MFHSTGDHKKTHRRQEGLQILMYLLCHYMNTDFRNRLRKGTMHLVLSEQFSLLLFHLLSFFQFTIRNAQESPKQRGCSFALRFHSVYFSASEHSGCLALRPQPLGYPDVCHLALCGRVVGVLLPRVCGGLGVALARTSSRLWCILSSCRLRSCRFLSSKS